MVLQDSPPNPASSILRQFIISDSMTGQNQFENQHFDVYDDSGLRGNNAYSQSLGVLPSIQSLRERMSRSMDLVQAPTVGEDSEISHTRHLMDLLGATNETNNQAQRLSLSLGSCVLVPSVQCRQRSMTSSDLINSNYMLSGEEAKDACNQGLQQQQQHHHHQQHQQQQRVNDDYSFMGSPFAASSSTSFNRSYNSSSYGGESFSNVVGNSRYLKPAQALLEEIVNVGGRDIDIGSERKLTRGGRRGGALGLSAELKAELCSNGILSVEKHELQVKIAKLISLLEEVEGRYDKYYHQMEEVVSSFEMVAGLGAAKTYTGLAFQAMSRHFCNLRDNIVSHINSTKRKICQDLPKINSGLTQLSLLDRENRHNRISLQQLAMIQSQRQAWRPIRGLPDTSVAILRSWLFEHFLHPYPNDSEKLMLASQTGLTKNQVSNWFINARVRLWKPMIEEMYKEEFGDSSEESNQLFASSSMTREDMTDHVED